MTDQSDHSGAITLPPVIFGAAFALGIGMDRIWPIALLPSTAQYAVGGLLALLSLVFALATAAMFLKHRTTIHVHRPTTALITDGPFGISRNPAYVALVLLYVGAGVAVDGIWIILMLIPAVAVLHFGVILREERYLEHLFGDAYRTYKARVRRWL